MAYNIKQSLNDNIQALKTVLESDGKKLTANQVEIVQKFGGWNNKIVLYDPYIDSEWETASKQDQAMRPMLKELHELLKWNMTGKQYTEAINSIRNACLTSYYSPEVLPATFYRVLSEYHKVQQMIEPSCGSGVFVNHVWKWFPDITTITMYEKDLLTGKLLQRITEGTIPKGVWRDVHIKPFEESDAKENGQYQLVSSNVPFGQMNVFDNSVPYYSLCNRIHCYFFAKGLDKLADRGILGFLVSNAFLDSSGNKEAREYVFTHSDFISLTVMPDNLMKDIANTEAPSHFLVCRKRVGKTEMSSDEKLLCESKYIKSEFGMYSMNCYIAEHPEIIIGTVKAGKNQYGKGAREVWWDGDISGISGKFAEILTKDFDERYERKTLTETFQELGKIMGPYLKEGEMIWDDQIVDIPEGLDDEYDNQLAQELEDEIHANMKDGCLGKDEDDEGLSPETLQEIAQKLDQIGKDHGIVPQEWQTRKIEDKPLTETFKGLGELMGKYLVDEDTPPWEDERECINDDDFEDEEPVSKETLDKSNREHAQEYEEEEGGYWGLVDAVIEHRKSHPDTHVEVKNPIPWEEEERTFSQAGLTTPYYGEQSPKQIQDTIHKAVDELKEQLSDTTTLEQLQINIPYKQGMIVKRVTPDTLFMNKEELVVVKSMSPLVVVPLEGNKSDKEKLMQYVEIRDCYVQLNQLENER